MKSMRCPHCNATVQYKPGSSVIVCEYCDSEISVEDYEASLRKKDYYTTNELSCTQCGAIIYSTDTTVATFCSYCGSSVLLNSRIVEEKRPDYIIPFMIDKDKAEKIYRDRISSLLLAPDWLSDESMTEKFRGIYMPYHIFSFDSDTPWSGQGVKISTETIDGKRYDVTRVYELETRVNAHYSNIPADASSSLPDSIGRGLCPYTKGKMEKFQESYLAGYYADGSDVDSEVYAPKLGALVLQDMSKETNITCSGINIDAKDVVSKCELTQSTKKALFPVWFMSFRKKDKVSYAAVNGETGELVVDIPIDFSKYVLISIIVAGLLCLAMNLFVQLTPSKFLLVSEIASFIMLLVSNGLLNDTYRRNKHLDDAGYFGVDTDTIKIKKVKNGIVRKKKHSGCLMGVIWIAIFVALCMFEDYIPEAFLDILLIGVLPIGVVAIIVICIVQSARNARTNKKGSVKIKKKAVPWYYKIFVLIKPVVGVAAGVAVRWSGTIDDMKFYMAGILAIVLIIFTAFDVVIIHNKFTMRDIPLFNEKRGGDL